MISFKDMPPEFRRTEPGATQTIHGWVPHKLHPLGFHMPVRVMRATGPRGTTVILKGEGGLPYPERNELGQYRYMLPGGGIYDF